MTNVTRKLSIKSRSNNVLRGAVPTTSSDLNIEILYDEVSEAVDKSNLRKSCLEIPNEAMKNKNAKLLLFKFFNLCFISGLNPSYWDFSDIIPIPKKKQRCTRPPPKQMHHNSLLRCKNIF